MIPNQNIDKLSGLGLHGMADEYLRQSSDPTCAGLGFDERSSLLIDSEEISRHEARFVRLIKGSRLPPNNANGTGVDYSHARGLDKDLMRSLLTCGFVRHGQDVVISGLTGCGKTWIASALGREACKYGFKTLFQHIPVLMEDLLAARVAGSTIRLLNKLAKVDLLILDDWGIAPFHQEAATFLFSLLDQRVGQKSTIITAQVPPQEWHACFGNATIADAIIDRLVNAPYKMALKGHSMRGRRAK